MARQPTPLQLYRLPTTLSYQNMGSKHHFSSTHVAHESKDHAPRSRYFPKNHKIYLKGQNCCLLQFIFPEHSEADVTPPVSDAKNNPLPEARGLLQKNQRHLVSLPGTAALIQIWHVTAEPDQHQSSPEVIPIRSTPNTCFPAETTSPSSEPTWNCCSNSNLVHQCTARPTPIVSRSHPDSSDTKNELSRRDTIAI